MSEFVIDNDQKAEWATRKIAEERQERDRLLELADSEIARLNEKKKQIADKCNDDTGYLVSLLRLYFESADKKKTKTMEKYKLLSGELILKKKAPKAVFDESELLEHLKKNSMTDYIKVTEKAQWGEFKKRLDLTGEKAIDTETGEVIDIITLEEQPDEFEVKI